MGVFGNIFGGVKSLGNIFGTQTPTPTVAPVQPVRPMGPGGAPDGSGIGQEQQITSTINPGLSAVRDTISYAEGTWDSQAGQPNYGMRYGDKPGIATLDTSKPHPAEFRASPWGTKGVGSDASGAYQFKSGTWRDVNDGDNPVMSPQNQDRAVEPLLERRGYDTNQPFRDQAHKLHNEWVSIPPEDGTSRWGQKVQSLDELDAFHNKRLSHWEAQQRMDIYRRR